MKNIATCHLLVFSQNTCIHNYPQQRDEIDANMTEIKKAPKKSFPTKKLTHDAKKKEAPKKPTTRMGRLLRGPLFWIIAAIFAVSIFGQITSAGNKYTKIQTSQALDAISTSDVESAIVVDKSQKLRLILKAGKTINGSSKVESSYVARQ